MKRSLVSRMGFVLIALSLTACGSTTSYLPFQSPPKALASRQASTVQVFPETTTPSRSYVTIGTVETQPDSAYADQRLTPELTAKMQREAAQAGCDGIIMLGPIKVPAETGTDGAGMSVSYRAACIVFTPVTAAE